MAWQVRGTSLGEKGLVRGPNWLVPDVGRVNWTGLPPPKEIFQNVTRGEVWKHLHESVGKLKYMHSKQDHFGHL